MVLTLCSLVSLSAQVKWVEIEAGGEFSIALRSDGSLWAWGANLNGNLGTGDKTGYLYPVQVGTDTDWEHIAAGGYHTLAIKEAGTLWGWGLDQVGSTGTGSGTNFVLVPTQVGNENDWASISAGYAHSLAIKKDGSLWGFGYNIFGQINESVQQVIPEPVLIDSNHVWIQVEAGGLHSTAVTADGKLYTWGFNGDGELGNGTTVNSTSPGLIDSAHTYIMVSAGTQATYGLRSDSTLWSWGFNGNNELGIDTTLSKSTLPLQIGDDTDWAWVEAGSVFGMALKSDSSLYAWGSNIFGQLGIGNKMNQAIPVKVDGNNWNQVALATGVITQQGIFGGHSLGLKGNNKVICATGANYAGQLGDSTTSQRLTFGCDIGAIIPTSTTSLENIYGIKVYPNPAADILKIDPGTLRNYKLVFYNQMGELLIKRENVRHLNVSFYPPGMYFLEIRPIDRGKYKVKRVPVVIMN